MFARAQGGTVAAAAILGALGLGGLADGALAQEFTLRIQTHYAPETPSGKLAAQFVDDVETMSGGRVDIEMFFSSSVVKSVETFDAAATGILDGDMTGGAYQTGKNPAFQFVGDPMGGYNTPWQQYAWFYYGGGEELADKLYHQFDMELIGWWVYGQEALASTKPIAGPEDLQDWKFRSPPGLETEIFDKLGASPIVMDFTEVFTALETGIIDGADAWGSPTTSASASTTSPSTRPTRASTRCRPTTSRSARTSGTGCPRTSSASSRSRCRSSPSRPR